MYKGNEAEKQNTNKLFTPGSLMNPGFLFFLNFGKRKKKIRRTMMTHKIYLLQRSKFKQKYSQMRWKNIRAGKNVMVYNNNNKLFISTKRFIYMCLKLMINV
jgi:hypothetical protein